MNRFSFWLLVGLMLIAPAAAWSQQKQGETKAYKVFSSRVMAARRGVPAGEKVRIAPSFTEEGLKNSTIETVTTADVAEARRLGPAEGQQSELSKRNAAESAAFMARLDARRAQAVASDARRAQAAGADSRSQSTITTTTAYESNPLPATGGNPFLFWVSGLALTACSLLLKRKLQ